MEAPESDKAGILFRNVVFRMIPRAGGASDARRAHKIEADPLERPQTTVPRTRSSMESSMRSSSRSARSTISAQGAFRGCLAKQQFGVQGSDPILQVTVLPFQLLAPRIRVEQSVAQLSKLGHIDLDRVKRLVGVPVSTRKPHMARRPKNLHTPVH